jgi:hypothetical protein
VIGNDIVDLALAQTESNWKRSPCYVMAIPIYQTEIVKDKIHTVQ